METTSDARPSLINEMSAIFASTISGAGLSVALAALIFVGPLADGLPRAAANFLVAGGVLTAVIGWCSQIRPSLSIIQDGPAIVFVTVAGSLAVSSEGDPVANVLIALSAVGVATGLAIIAVGRTGAGDAIRFFPATVIDGFIAGTGWLLFKGGLDVMVGETLGLDDVADFFSTDVLGFWLPGVALGIVIVALGSSARVPSAMVGASVLVATVAFFVVTTTFSSVSEAEAANWFIGPFPDGTSVSPLTPADLQQADWGGLASQGGAFVALVAVSIVALLLNLSGLESLTGRRVDLRRELQMTGAINIAVAPLAAVAGFHGLGDTVLAQKMGARTRWVGVGVGTLAIAAGILGPRWLAFTPRVIAGGLLVAVGVGLLVDWMRSMSRSGRTDRVLSVGILILIGAVGILEGITAGLVAACIIFVVRYSRIDPVKLEARASDIPSRVVRPAAEAAALAEHADEILVVQLTGYQFFGSFAAVIERIESATRASPTSMVVLDFRFVTGIDSSGLSLMSRLVDDLGKVSIPVLLSDVTSHPAVVSTVQSAPSFPGLDFAVEHAEEQLLQRLSTTSGDEPPLFSDLSAELRNALTERVVDAGDVVIEQDLPASASSSPPAVASLFLIVSGDLAVIRVTEDGSAHRLRRIGAGAVVGERSVLLDEPRSARIVAETKSTLLELDVAAYRRLQVDHPRVALELQGLLLVELSQRSVALSNQLSRALR